MVHFYNFDSVIHEPNFKMNSDDYKKAERKW